jgi:cell division protein FtsW (lipid II flippase)
MMARLYEWLLENATAPNLVLCLLLGLGCVVLMSSSKEPPGRLGNLLADESGKVSSSRLAMFIALGISSYMLVYLTINRKVNDETLFYVYAVYLISWASSKTLDKLVGVWGASKGVPSKPAPPDLDSLSSPNRGSRPD